MTMQLLGNKCRCSEECVQSETQGAEWLLAQRGYITYTYRAMYNVRLIRS